MYMRRDPMAPAEACKREDGLVIASKRLTYRPTVEEDAVHFSSMLSSKDIQMTGSIPDPLSKEDAATWIREKARSGVCNYMILKDEQVLGSIGYKVIKEKIWLGYWIGNKYAGNGYCTEAVNALIEALESPLTMESSAGAGLSEVEYFTADTFPENPASIRILGKAGFSEVGTMDVDVPLRGGMRTLRVFRRPFTPQTEIVRS